MVIIKNMADHNVDNRNAGIEWKKLILLAGAIGVSFSAVFIRMSDCPVLVLVFYRMLITSALLAFPALRHIRSEKNLIPGRDIIFSIISGLFLTAHFTSYFYAVRTTTVASAVVLSDTEIFWVAIASFFLLHEKLSRKSIIGMILAFTGCCLVAMADTGGEGSLEGDIFAVLSAVTMMGYTLMGRLARRHMSTSLYTFIVYSATWIASLVILLVTDVPVCGYGPSNLLAALGMALVCTLAGHNIYSWALRYFSAATVSTAKLLEAVFSAALAVALYHEIPGPAALFGCAAVLFGVYLSVNS